MSKNPKDVIKNQDEILQIFEQTKEEQLDLLEGLDKNKKEHETEININDQVIEDDKESKDKYYQGTDGTEYTEGEWNSPVVRNGPTRKEVEGWKKRYNHVYFTPFDGETFVWRTLQRPEYREIIRDQTITALDREEMFTEKCVLYPYDFSLEKIRNSRAGIASLLSEMIMDKSGFVAQSAPIKL